MGVKKQPETFEDLMESNPCAGCPAPCCRMLLWPQQPPGTLKEVDQLRYMILFQNKELAVSADGQWSLVTWQPCMLFEEKSCTCSAHGTAKKPLVCVEFSPHQCWYKRNYVDGYASAEIIRLNLPRFEVWLKQVTFDNTGAITGFPSYDQIAEMIAGIPVEPRFRLDQELQK